MTALVALSLGAGVQSTTLALLAVEGILPKPDVAIFADTGWEPAAVYTHLDRLEVVLATAGIPLIRAGRGNLRDDVLDPYVHANIPAYVLGASGKRGAINRRCTGRYKVEPIEQEVRHLLGAKVREVDCRYCEGTGTRVAPWVVEAGPGPCSVCRGNGRRRLVGSVPRGSVAAQWIGFSIDEAHRVNDSKFPRYVQPVYPLLDLGMSRKDCGRWLAARDWTVVKSACIGCPFHGNRAWREMRDEHPADWADAVTFDRDFRTGAGLDGQRFLHASRVPLDLAPIDRVTRGEWNDRQVDLFDLIAEEGDPDGCSPYGCRSGEAIA